MHYGKRDSGVIINMRKNNKDNNTQLMEAAKERLYWYTMEATEEEFNEEEVDALVNLLQTLEPVKKTNKRSDSEELNSFYEYVQQREKEEGHDLVWTHKKRKGMRLFVRNHKIMTAVAAVFLFILVARGSWGVVNAHQGNGFFYWLRQDEEGMTMLTSPDNISENLNAENAKEYASMEELPEEYKKYLVDLKSIKQLQDYKLKCIKVNQMDDRCGVKRCYVDESGEKRIYVGMFIYSDEVSLSRESYFSKEYDSSITNNYEEGILLKEDLKGGMECTIYFYKNNIRYYVEGNVDKDILTEIAMEYKNIVFE